MDFRTLDMTLTAYVEKQEFDFIWAVQQTEWLFHAIVNPRSIIILLLR